jgi:hypothetical protein
VDHFQPHISHSVSANTSSFDTNYFLMNQERKKEALIGMTQLPEPHLYKPGAHRECEIYEL